MFSFLLTYCTLTYCGLGIPEQICVKLIDVISECSKNEDWMVKLPMFKLTNLSTRAAIRHVFKSWLANIATKKLTYCLDRYDIGEHDQEPAYYSSEVLREKKIKEQENYRQQILELTDDRILITVPDDKVYKI